MPPKTQKRKCPHCGQRSDIRPDRTYCSLDCFHAARSKKSKHEKRDTTQRVVFSTDHHIPHLDPKFWSILMQVIQDVKPTWKVLGGDFLDEYNLSLKFAQPGSPGPGFPFEVDEGERRLKQLRRELPASARLTWIEGNHDYRLKSLLNMSPHAAKLKNITKRGVKVLTVPYLMDLKKHGCEYVECPNEKWTTTKIDIGQGFYLGHFDKCNKWAGYAAKNIQDILAASFITGHNHSGGVIHRTTASGAVWGFEGGCGCYLNPPYMEPTNWAQMIHVIHIEKGVPPEVERIHIQDGRARYGGRLYRA